MKTIACVTGRWTAVSQWLAGALAALTLTGAASAEEVWRLDNLQKIAGHEVTVLGAPRIETAAKDGPAMVFDGVRDGIFLPTIPIAGAKQFTVEVLFRPAEGGPEAQRFVHWQDKNEWRGLIELRLNGKGGWWLDTFLFTGEGKGTALIDPNRVHPTDSWHWAALRYDGKTMAHFVDGQKELESAATFAPFAAGQISLGVRQNKVFWFKGAIREVRFHTEALPPEKLQRIK